jgi:hypothetical protein
MRIVEFVSNVKINIIDEKFEDIKNVVSSNLADGEEYWIQQYVIKFVSVLWQFGGFPRLLRFPPPIKIRPRRLSLYLCDLYHSDVLI